jgi:hypothetical protein
MHNYAAHKDPKVNAWLAANPRIHVHLTPTSGSWLNLVEVWFGIVERQATAALSIRSGPLDQDPGLHQRLERPLPTLRLDQSSRPDPDKANRKTTSIAAQGDDPLTAGRFLRSNNIVAHEARLTA